MMASDEPTAEISCTVNGQPVRAHVPLRQSLVDFVRHGLGLTGSHVGCEHGVCGACHAVVDGRVAMPDAPGIGFERKAELWSVMKELQPTA